MNKTLILIKNKGYFFLIFLLMLPAKSFSKTIRIGLNEYPPHIVSSGNHISGTMVSYFKYIYGEEYDDIKFFHYPTKRGIVELKKGNIDLLFPYINQSELLPTLGEAVFNVVPGICFKKANFLPFLSAPNVLDKLNIGVPAGVPLVSTINESNSTINYIEGSDTLERGIQLLLKERIDGFYHSSPINIYHYSNPLYSKIACSFFYGFSRKVHIAITPLMDVSKKKKLKLLFKQTMHHISYEYFRVEN